MDDKTINPRTQKAIDHALFLCRVKGLLTKNGKAKVMRMIRYPEVKRAWESGK